MPLRRLGQSRATLRGASVPRRGGRCSCGRGAYRWCCGVSYDGPVMRLIWSTSNFVGTGFSKSTTPALCARCSITLLTPPVMSITGIPSSVPSLDSRKSSPLVGCIQWSRMRQQRGRLLWLRTNSTGEPNASTSKPCVSRNTLIESRTTSSSSMTKTVVGMFGKACIDLDRSWYRGCQNYASLIDLRQRGLPFTSVGRDQPKRRMQVIDGER